MPVQKTEKIWHNGKMINWDDAQLHVLSHVVSYGSGIFEGIRTYDTPAGPSIFRLREHMQRLINSGKIYRMEIPFSVEEFSGAACELVRLNKMGACYVKPIVLRGYGEVGVNPFGSPIDATWPVGTGVRISARKHWQRAWTFVSAPGRASHPTLCPLCPKRRQII